MFLRLLVRAVRRFSPAAARAIKALPTNTRVEMWPQSDRWRAMAGGKVFRVQAVWRPAGEGGGRDHRR